MARSHFIRDNRGLTVGRIDEDDRERRAYDACGRYLGRYDLARDHTYDQRGVLVSTGGDILSSLIFGIRNK